MAGVINQIGKDSFRECPFEFKFHSNSSRNRKIGKSENRKIKKAGQEGISGKSNFQIE